MSTSSIRSNPLVKRATALAAIGGMAAVGALALNGGSSRAADDSAASPPQPAAAAEQSTPAAAPRSFVVDSQTYVVEPKQHADGTTSYVLKRLG